MLARRAWADARYGAGWRMPVGLACAGWVDAYWHTRVRVLVSGLVCGTLSVDGSVFG